MTASLFGTMADTAIFPALGATAQVVARRELLPEAVAVVRQEIGAMDLAASRFRADSELVALNCAAGSTAPFEVSALLFEAIEVALRAASLTDGLVDPTIGRALELAGYDRDFARVDPDGPPLILQATPAPGWAAVKTDPRARTVSIPRGVVLDLGATAKALCADRAAERAASAVGCGVLVGLGGDVATAGPAPDEGWPIRITDEHEHPQEASGPVVSIAAGGLATSSTSVRRWVRGGQVLHHLIDPATGTPVAEHWKMASVAAGSCVDANIASCASMLLGTAAPAWLEERNLPGRLVDPAARVMVVAGWPADAAASEHQTAGAR